MVTYKYNPKTGYYEPSGGGTATYSNGQGGTVTVGNGTVTTSPSGGSSGGSSKSSGGGGGGSYNFVDPSVLQDAQVNGLTPEQIDAKWGTGTSTNVANYNNTYYSSGSSYSSPTLNATKTVSSPYVNQGAGNYSYNPTSGYYQKVTSNSNNQGVMGGEDQNHYGTLYDKDKFSPDTTYNWDSVTDTANNLLNQNNINQNIPDANVDLTGKNNKNMNNFGSFEGAVLNKLQTAFGIQDLDELKAKYPEQYPSLIQALKNVSGVWNATDPSQRNLLEGQLQAIIGTAVGAGSDTSKLNVLSESILAKFKEPNQVKQFVADVTRLQTEGMSTAQIAKQMGVSEDMVQQGILAANQLDNKLGEYFELTEEASKDITEPYDTKIARLEEEKKIALERANREIERLKQDFDTNYERQRVINEQNKHNADFLSGQYGFGFSKRGLEGLDYVETQAKQIIDDMVKNYDRTKIEIADGITDIIRNWEWNNEDLMKASEDALTNAKNVYTSNMLAIQQQYGTVGMQAQQQLANNVQNFITQAESIYDNALTRQQQNLSNLITNFSNLNALSLSNLTLRNTQIQQFQQESMNLNRNQLQGLAQQLGMDSASFQDLVNYQAQAVANTLNGYKPGSGMQFQNEIQSLLDSGYTPNQVISSIVNSQDFKDLQASYLSSSTWKSAGNGWLYDDYGNTKRIEGYTTSTSSAKAATTDSNGNYQRVKLDETPNEDTGIPNVYGNTVKLAPTVGAMLEEAYNNLSAQGIELKIADSYRSYDTQKQAYESGKAGVVSPDKSYHVLGQAFDLSQAAADGMKDNEEVTQALLDAGFTRPNAKEWWHWSYGEGKDAFGGKPRNTTAYDMADAILNGVGTLPAKNSKEFSDVVTALNDRVKQIRGQGYPEGEELINYSVIFDNALGANEQQSISATAGSIYSTDMLMKLLEENEFKTGPIMSRIAGRNPRDADYAAINASINAMASNIARGFGEKGVLSDKDIERYMKTLPNTKIGKNAQEVVGTLLKAKLYNGLINVLETAAKNKRDVSMYIQNYQEAVNWLQQNGFMEGGGRGLQGTIDLSNYGRS